jgi:hypothetical protein
MAVKSTAWAGAAPGEEDVVEAAGGVGLVGATVPTVLVGEATAGEAGTALVEGAAVACPNIFDMRLVNIPITAKDTPRPDKKTAQPFASRKRTPYSPGTADGRLREALKKMPTLSLYSLSVCTLS